MKSRFLILLSTLLLTLSVQAQPGGGQGGMRMDPAARVTELIAALEITPQQEPAFREAMAAITQQQMAAMQAMRQGGGAGAGAGAQGGGGGGQGMARRAEMQAQVEAALAPVLTEAQMTRFREVEAARMEEMRARMMQQQQ